MARRGWLAALLLGAAGTLGGVLGATAGGVAGVVIGLESAPTRAVPAHEDLFGGILILLRAAGFGAAGSVAGAIAGAVLGSLLGSSIARKVLPPARPEEGDSDGWGSSSTPRR